MLLQNIMLLYQAAAKLTDAAGSRKQNRRSFCQELKSDIVHFVELLIVLGHVAKAAIARNGARPAANNKVPSKGNVMNALTKWDPFKEMEELQGRFAKLLGLAPARIGNGEKELMTIT